MVASLADYHRLVSIHRPLGILILIVVAIRFVNRRYSTLPPFPATMSPRSGRYSLLFLLPLLGWGMLSAARYPILLYGSSHLPPILPHSVLLYAVLRRTHTVLAYLLFLTFLAHFGAVLFHTLVVRDGIFSRMAPWRIRARQASLPQRQTLRRLQRVVWTCEFPETGDYNERQVFGTSGVGGRRHRRIRTRCNHRVFWRKAPLLLLLIEGKMNLKPRVRRQVPVLPGWSDSPL
jgi:cytochrome b561